MNRGYINILDELENKGEENVRRYISTFSSPISPKIENFLKNRAIDFSRRKVSITYLVSDLDDGSLPGFFALTHKAVLIPSSTLSNTMRKKIDRFARLDRAAGEYMASAFLIAQFGKNYDIDNGKRITGQELMSVANDVLVRIQHMIGGGIVYLDCEDVESLKQFYTREHFHKFGERFAEEEAENFIQYMRLL
ncbi:MAG: hypothetical protein IJR85_02150 [Synergistaceae bacterium]|nr:hypothetical protein [Synergistaceae bacterium]